MMKTFFGTLRVMLSVSVITSFAKALNEIRCLKELRCLKEIQCLKESSITSASKALKKLEYIGGADLTGTKPKQTITYPYSYNR